MYRAHKFAGFTVIELLVAVTIMVVLMSLLLAAIQQSRAAARNIACQSNLRQWGLAVQNYASTHHGYLPRRGQGVNFPTLTYSRNEDWFNALPAYMNEPTLNTLILNKQTSSVGGRSVWMCPDLGDKPVTPSQPNLPKYFAYGMNMWLSTPKAVKPDHIDRVGPRHTMVFMADGIGTQCSVLPAYAPPSDDPSWISSPVTYNPDARHSGMVNIVFLDGHVKGFRGDYVGCGVGIPGRPDISWIVPHSPWSGP